MSTTADSISIVAGDPDLGELPPRFDQLVRVVICTLACALGRVEMLVLGG